MNRLRLLLEHEVVMFILLGGVNTVLTQLLYMALLFVIPYGVSYTITYAVGIPLAYWLNSTIVFKSAMSWQKFIQYPSVYVVQYVLGMVLMYVFIELVSIPKMVAPIPIMALLIPITFVMTRYIIK
jgi:putative flippase GtrA